MIDQRSHKQQEEMRERDVVRLNSGSPDMEIIASRGDLLTVQWTNEGRMEEYKINRHCVSLVSGRASRDAS
jgi:hypothetical protein